MDKLVVAKSNPLVADGWIIEGPSMMAARPMTLAEYNEQAEHLKMAEGFVQFWIGDWANQGKEEHGRGVMTELAEQTGWSETTVWKYAYIGRQYETLPRGKVLEEYPLLTHRHFEIAAAQDDRLDWLRKAGENGWSAAKLSRAIKDSKGELPDFDPRVFNHWPAWGLEHWQRIYEYGGQVSGNILLNVIHLTTNKGDLVIDPMAGPNNMGLACARLGRRCIAYDIRPDHRYPEILQHNALEPFPDQGAQMIYIDPPYWRQKSYSSHPDDLAIGDLSIFYDRLTLVCHNAIDALGDGGILVLIIGATQDKTGFYDHATEMYKRIDLPIINRVAAAYPTEQYTPIEKARALDDKRLLNLYTTILFWKKP